MGATKQAAPAPRVSVVMPTHNVGDWIAQTIESIQGQTLTEWELIVVDDASSDDTVAQVEELASSDPRITLVANPTRGGAEARNFGVTLASGEFLAFCDGDDVVPRDAYRALVTQADASGSEMVVGNHLVVEPQRLSSRDESVAHYDGVRPGLTIIDEPRVLRDRVCWNRIIRRSSWDALGSRFATSARSNDIAAMTSAYCSLRFDLIAAPVYAYRRRVGTSSMTASKHRPASLEAHFEQERACAELVERVGDPDVTAAYYTQILALDLWAHGVAALSSPDPAYDRARQQLVEIVARAPKAAWVALDARRRLAYHLAQRRLWPAAALVAEGDDGTALARRLEDLDGPELFRSVFVLEPTLRDGLVELLDRACLRPLRERPYDLADEEVMRLYRLGVLLRRFADLDSYLGDRERRLLHADFAYAAPIRSSATALPPSPRPPSIERRVRGIVRAYRRKGPAAALAEAYRTAQYLRVRQVVDIARRTDRADVRRVAAQVRKRVRRAR